MLINDLLINIIAGNVWLLFFNHIGLLREISLRIVWLALRLFLHHGIAHAKPTHHLHEVGLAYHLQVAHSKEKMPQALDARKEWHYYKEMRYDVVWPMRPYT